MLLVKIVTTAERGGEARQATLQTNYQLLLLGEAAKLLGWLAARLG